LKNKESAIRDIIYSDNNIVNYVKEAPQTYNSFLKEFKDCGTFQLVLRRRISRLIKQNRLWKLRIPGTRYGLVLFCTPEHDYKMLAYNRIVGKTRVFYMYDYKIEDNNIVLDNYWELKDPNWNHWEYSDTIIKIPKFGNRNDVVRLWE